MSAAPAIVRIDRLSKTFKSQKVLNDISLEITRGAFHALVGENGSGKSTLIKAIVGAYPASAYQGHIVLAPQTRVSYTPEVANFPGQWDVKGYLRFIALLLYPSPNEANLMVDTAVSKFEIKALLNKNPNKLSSGEKKKVLLAKTLIEDADLIVMDEPAANLDFGSRKFLFDTLKEFNALGKTILIVSHMTSEISPYVNEMTLLHYGQLWVNKAVTPGALTSVYEQNLALRAKAGERALS